MDNQTVTIEIKDWIQTATKLRYHCVNINLQKSEASFMCILVDAQDKPVFSQILHMTGNDFLTWELHTNTLETWIHSQLNTSALHP